MLTRTSTRRTLYNPSAGTSRSSATSAWGGASWPDPSPGAVGTSGMRKESKRTAVTTRRIVGRIRSPSGLDGDHENRSPRKGCRDDDVHARTRADREVRPRPGGSGPIPPQDRLSRGVPQADLCDLRGRKFVADRARAPINPGEGEPDPIHVRD